VLDDLLTRTLKKGTKKGILHKKLYSVHHQSCGAAGGDDGSLLALLPVPRQQHGGVWMEVLVDLGK